MAPDPERPPIFVPSTPGAPAPSWSSDRGCPRCGSSAITADEIEPRFLLLSLWRPARCSACGMHFSTRTGRSVTPVVVAAYLLPALLFVVVLALVLLLR